MKNIKHIATTQSKILCLYLALSSAELLITILIPVYTKTDKSITIAKFLKETYQLDTVSRSSNAIERSCFSVSPSHLLGFTKLMSGINLAEYVINYIDQHMLISGFFLGKINNQILVSTENEATVKYTLTGLSDYEKGSIEVFKEHIKNILNE